MTLRTVVALQHGSMVAFEQRYVEEEQSNHFDQHVRTAALMMFFQHSVSTSWQS